MNNLATSVTSMTLNEQRNNIFVPIYYVIHLVSSLSCVSFVLSGCSDNSGCTRCHEEVRVYDKKASGVITMRQKEHKFMKHIPLPAGKTVHVTQRLWQFHLAV